MTWILFLDDVRELGTYPCRYEEFDGTKSLIWIARSTQEAIDLVNEHGLPSCMLLDHDLGEHFMTGEEDTTMKFLHLLAEKFDFSVTPPPNFMVHSANPIGALNIQAFMKSWKDVYKPE